MSELVDWFGKEITVPMQQAPTRNPCLALFGKGTEGVTCKNCVHLRYDQGYRRKRYWCDEVAEKKDSWKPEHMVGWPSCGKYERREEPYYGG